MPDFDVNEGYAEAGRRRADSPLSSRVSMDDGRVSAEGYGISAGEDFAPAPGVHAESVDAIEAVESNEAVEGARRLPEQRPIVRRTRHLATGHLATGGMLPPARRVGVQLMARRRRLARRACPYGWQVRVLDKPPRKRRRLWTTCHRSPGPLS